MQTDPIIIETVLKASTHSVWLALTNRAQMAKWYFDLKEFKAEPGFHFEFLAGDHKDQYLHICEVKEVIVDSRISYSWCYEGDPGYTVVCFDLFSQGDQTRLVLTHSGVDSFDPGNGALKRENFERGWHQIVENQLKTFVSQP